jgi:hypothetical protein
MDGPEPCVRGVAQLKLWERLRVRASHGGDAALLIGCGHCEWSFQHGG